MIKEKGKNKPGMGFNGRKNDSKEIEDSKEKGKNKKRQNKVEKTGKEKK